MTIKWAKETPKEEEVLEAALAKVVKIHKESPPGAILVFLTGTKIHEKRMEGEVERRRRRRGNPLFLPFSFSPSFC